MGQLTLLYISVLFHILYIFDCQALIQFNKVPFSEVVVPGKPFWWHCTATLVGTNTVLSYTWILDNQLLISDSNRELFQNGTLLLRSVSTQDAGSYRCRAQGGGELAFTEPATLSLAFLASLFSSNPASQVVSVGSPLLMECSIESDPPATITWLHNGITAGQRLQVTTELESILTVSTLNVDAVDHSDGGQYRCKATNTLLPEQVVYSEDASLTLQGRPGFVTTPSPQTVTVGDSVTFQCTSTGTPSASIQWLDENGSVLQTSGRYMISQSSLRIIRVQLSDRGYYTCKAINSWGENTASALLTVLTNPSQQVAFTERPSDVSIQVGGRVTFSCAGTGNPAPSVTWSKRQGSLPMDRIDSPAAGWLRVDDIISSDGGIYVCTLSNGITTATANAQLIVQEPPSFVDVPVDVTVISNGSVELDCKADGYPSPAITWLTPVSGLGTVLTPSTPTSYLKVNLNGTLLIDPAGREYAGVYTCTATNVLGSISTLASITVVGPPHITVAPNDQTRIVGTQTQFTCRGTSSTLPVTISWLYGNIELVTGSHYEVFGNGDLRISNIKKDHEGTYTCRLQNEVGYKEASANLRVLVPPSFTIEPVDTVVDVGSNVTLNCASTGDPLPDLQWQKDGEALVLEDNAAYLSNYSLVIVNLEKKNTGLYTCIASSIAGRREVMVELSVPDIPEFTLLPSNTTANQSQSFALPCRASARESPVIMWYTSDASGTQGSEVGRGQGSDVSPGQGSQSYLAADGDLQFLVVTVDDEGWYLCKAENGAGRIKEWLYMSVNYAPAIVNTNSPVKLMTTDLNILLRCDVDGKPPPYVTWYVPSGDQILDQSDGYRQQIVGTARYLVVYNPLIEVHDGDFICEANNILGQFRQTVTVSIEGAPVIILVAARPLGTSVTLSCQTKGAPDPSVTWYRNTLPVLSFYVNDHTQLNDGQLVISNLTRAQTGQYQCQLTNKHGVATATLSVPNAPVTPLVSSVTSTSVTLTWNPPSPASNLTLDSYIINYYTISNKPTQREIETADFVYTISDLGIFTGYQFRVVAQNGLGRGSFSPWTDVVFTAEAVPTVVRRLEANVIGSSIALTWEVPVDLNGPTNHIIYEIKYGLASSSSSVTELVPYSDDHEDLTLYDLRDSSEYEIRLRVGNTKLELWSDEVTIFVETFVDAPSLAIRDFAVIANGSTALLATWQPVNDSSFEHYILIYRHLSTDTEYPLYVIDDAAESMFLITNLRYGEEYAVKMTYTNAGGNAPFTSERVAMTLKGTVPTPIPFGRSINSAALGGILSAIILLLIILLVVILVLRWKKNKREFSGTSQLSPDSLWINRRFSYGDTISLDSTVDDNSSEKKGTYEVAIVNENYKPDETIMSTDSACDLGSNDYVELSGNKPVDEQEEKKKKKKKRWRSISDVIYKNPDNPGVVLVKKAVIGDNSLPPVEMKSEEVLNQHETSPRLLDSTLDVSTPDVERKDMSPSPEFPVFPNAEDSINFADDSTFDRSMFSLDEKDQKEKKKKEEKERRERDEDFDIGYKKRKTLSDLIGRKVFSKRKYSIEDLPYLEPHSSSIEKERDIAALY